MKLKAVSSRLFKRPSITFQSPLLWLLGTLFLFVPAFLRADSLPVPRGTPGDLWADVVLGQPDYGIPNSGFGDIQFNQATSISAFHLGGTIADRTNGVLYVWDSGNNRILGFSIASLAPDPGADQEPVPILVLGQPDFFHTGCDHDSNWQNYPTPPSASADCLCGLSYSLQSPAEAGSKANMDVDAQGNLYVPDYFNNRILRYDAQPGGAVTSLEPATYEWGQPDFTGWAVNNVGADVTGSPNNHNLYLSPVPPGGGAGYFPLGTNTAEAGVAVDAWGSLWVADDWNHRVLRFPSPTGSCCAAPSPNADLVLGQTGFTSNSTGPLVQPVAVRVDKAGNVYVVALYANPNSFAVFVYKPTTPGNGATPPVYGGGSGFVAAAAMTFAAASSAYSSGVEWDAESPNGIGGAPALGQSGGLWVARDQEIDLLKISLSASNNITWTTVKTLMNDTPNDTAGSPAGDNSFNFADAADAGNNSTIYRQPALESPGVDAAGNVYWISPGNNACNGIYRFPGPIPAPVAGVVHSTDVEILKPFIAGLENIPSYKSMHYAGGVAVASFRGVTQVVAGSDMLRFWNMPSGGPAGFVNGQRVDGLIGGANSSQPLLGLHNGFSRVKADRVGHVWTLGNSQQSVWAYNLPLTDSETPFLQLALNQPIPLAGGGTIQLTNIPGQGGTAHAEGMAVAADASYLWVTDQYGSRVMRIRNPLTSPMVDIILGQPNSTSTMADYPGGSPLNTNLNNPGSVALDQYGNLFVGDHSLEVNGDGRILRYDAPSIQNSTNTPQYGVAAAMTYNAIGPWEPALSPNDTVMTTGSDAQSGGYLFTEVFLNPLAGNPNPAAFLKDYGPQDYSETFDDDGNLYVANHNRSRVLIYLQPFQTPTATLTPTFTGSWTPTATLTATVTSTPTATPSPTISPTPTASPTSTPSATWTNTWDPAVPTWTPTPTPNCCQTVWTIPSGPLPYVDGLAFDASGPGTLYAGGGANILGLNPLTGGVLNNSMPASFEAITDMAFGGDGYLYVADYNGKVLQTQVPSGNIAVTFNLPEGGVRSLSVAPGSLNPDVYVGCDSGNVYRITRSGSNYSLGQLSFSPDANPVHHLAPGILFVPGISGAPATFYLSDCNICQRVIQYVQVTPGSDNYAYNASYQTSNGNVYMGRIKPDAFGNIYVGGQVEYLTFDPNFNLRWTCAIAPVYGHSIAVDPYGNVYTGHQSQETIIKQKCSVPDLTATPTLSPTFTPTFPPPPSLSCPPVGPSLPVSQPWGLALDPSGNLYAVDASTNAVDRFSAGGVAGTPLSLGPEALPLGVAVDGNGFIYVTDEQQDEVDIFNSTGTLVGQWGAPGSGPGQFEAPYGIAVTTGSGGTTAFVVDQGNQRVQEWRVTTTGSPAVSFVTAWGFPGLSGNGGFSLPAGIGLDGQGEVYVADQGTGIVQVFDGAGNWKRQWDVTLETPLLTANFLAVYQNCLVYVTDGFGGVGVFASDGGSAAYMSGTGTGVNFTDTEGVAVGNGGWMVADMATAAVYRFGQCPVTSCGMSPPTATPTSTPTLTLTASATASPTPTVSSTPTGTASNSPTPSPSGTPTASPSPTLTGSPTSSPTPTSTPTPSLTVTSTPTPTYSATPTSSPTVTITSTATASPTEGCHDLGFYPNPCRDFLHLHFSPCDQGRNIRVKVFTLAFRKMVDRQVTAPGPGVDTALDLADDWGKPLANGLYYLVIDRPEGRTIGKLLILR